MQNIKSEVKAKILTLTIDLSKSMGVSKSGKSELIASTEGNVEVCQMNGKPVKMGLNIYSPRNGGS